MVFLHILFLTSLILQATAQQSTQNISLVYPALPAPPILTKHQLLQELSSWQTIQIFTTLLQAHPYLIPSAPSLILAPTNHAFLTLLSRLAPQSDNPFSTAASITNTLDKLLNTGNLTRILAYHIIPKDLAESQLTTAFLTASGGVVSFTDFPNILDIDPVTEPRRLYRQIRAVDGSFMFLSDVLLPLPLDVIVPGINNAPMQDGMLDDGPPGMVNGTIPGIPENATFPNGSFPNGSFPNGSFPNSFENDTIEGPPFPPEHEGPDFFSAVLSALSPALSQEPFVSNAFLIASRTDLQIMNALLRFIPGLHGALNSGLVHVLAPTDTAFMKLLVTLGAKVDLPDMSLPDISDPGFLSNLTELLKIGSAAERVWRSVEGLPGLAEIVAYHITPNGADYESLMEMSRTTTIQTALQNHSLVFQSDSIIDGDPSRDDPMPIASFPTLTGFVTLLDGVLTPFDTSVAGAVINGALDSPTPSPTTQNKEESEKACFPADGMVHTKYGVAKLGDLIGGDEILVDHAVERRSAVFLFTHKDMDGTHDFVKISTVAGYNVTLTSGHYIHSKGSLVAAGSLRVGDILHTIDGDSAVTKVEQVRGRGLVAPHTVDGGLIVDGVLVSGYSRAVHPWVAHALLTPVRWYVKVSGDVEPFGAMFYRGGRGLERLVPSGGVEYSTWKGTLKG